MASQSALESAAHGFAERGRTLTGKHVIDLVELSVHRSELEHLGEGADGATHLEVTVARGRFGPEVLVQPRSGDTWLPGELYAQVPGAFGAPCAYDNTSGPGLAWASPSNNLQDYLRTHQFGAPALPGGHRNGQYEINLDWTVQLQALDVDQSIVVCQVSSDEPAVVAAALATVDHLARATSQSRAAGPQQGLHGLRFGAVVELALSGQLDSPLAASPPPPSAPAVASPPPPSAPAVASPPPPSAPVASPIPVAIETFDTDSFDSDTFGVEISEPGPNADLGMSETTWDLSAPNAGTIDAQAAVTEALHRYEGKRVTVGSIADQKKLANVLKGIAPGVEADEICGFVDTGLRTNGKSGAVFTRTAIHFSGLSECHQYDYTSIESFELEGSAVIINGADGRRAKIFTGGQALAIAEAVAAATGLSV